MKKQNKMKITIFAIIMVVGSMLFVQALSTQAPGTYVVQLGEDEQVQIAVDTLEENLPDISIIKFGSLKHLLLSYRFIETTIWVGHGSEEGIHTGKEVISWLQFSKDIVATPSKDVVLSCYSNELYQKSSLTKNDVIGFNKEIDAEFGSLYVAYAFTGNENTKSKLLDRLFTLVNSPNEFEPLTFSIYEQTYWLAMTLIAACTICLDFVLDYNWGFVQSTVAKLLAVGHIGIVLSLLYWYQGYISWTELCGNLVGFVLDALGCLIDHIYAMSIWEQLLTGISLLASLLVVALEVTFSGGTSIAAKLLIASVTFYIIGVEAFCDYVDADIWVG